jgi:DNA-binding NarL/FixJ family response regulator/signal transduction histidine kinase
MPEREDRKVSPLPRFALPEVVGVAMSVEAVAAVVQQSVEAMAAGLACARLIAMSYVPRENLVRGVATAGFRDEGFREWQWTLAEFPAAERAIRTQQVVIAPDASGLPAPLRPWLPGPGEIVVVPLALGGRALAVLIGQVRPETAVRSAAWQARAEEVAARAALVVELERVSSAYQDQLRLRQSTREVAAAILEGRPLEQVAELITETVAARLREERVALYLGDVTGSVQPISLRNVSASYGEAAARMAPRSVLVTRATATGLPIYARNVQDDPLYSPEMRELLRRENITAILMAMLHYGQEMRGALVVYPQGRREFTPAELSFFQSFADMATIGVAISERMQQQRDVAMMEERNRLAREMHDTVAQTLAGLTLQIETIQTHLLFDNREAASEMLEAARAQAKKALEDTRRAVQGLAPVPLERLTPAQAIEEEARQFEAQEGIPTPFLLSGEEQPLMPEQRTALLRIAQEALSNARKHARATRVRVGLQYGPEEVVLVVEDDGVGFDLTARAAPGPEGGYGLFGMNERARLLGGEARIESTPGWGTRVLARLPYRPASALTPGQSVRAPEPSAPGTESPRIPAPIPVRPPPLSATAIRALVVDDHAVTRQGLRAMLEANGDIIVVGEASDGAQAQEQARALHPDVVLMDLQMPNVDGLEGLRRIHAEQPELPVVVVTTFQTDDSVREALGAGARGYLLKDAEPADLVAAVRAAHRGETPLAPAVTERLTALALGQAGPANAGAGSLNEREREVLQLLAQGARNKEIAARLFIATKTVEYHLSNIYSKLNVSNRTEAVRAAIERGLVISQARTLK